MQKKGGDKMIRSKKRKGTSAPSIFEKAKKLRPELSRDDVVALLRYDLHPTKPGEKADGIVIVDRENITVFLNGEETDKIRFIVRPELSFRNILLSDHSGWPAVGRVY